MVFGVVISIITIVLLLILWKITKKLAQAIFLLFIISVVVMSIGTFILIKDLQSFAEFQTTESLYVLKEGDSFIHAEEVNFSSGIQRTLSLVEITAVETKFKENKTEGLSEEYARVFIFDMMLFEETLDDQIILPDGNFVTKEETIKVIKEGNEEERAAFFVLAIANTLNFGTPGKLQTFLEQIEKEQVIIHPPSTTLTVFSWLPNSIVKTAEEINAKRRKDL